MRVLLTGGGTSGHVNPALAIADVVKEREPGSEFAYIGTERGIEKKLAEKEGISFYPIKVQGIRPSLAPSNIKTAFLAAAAPMKAKKIIEKFNPDVVIGTGGYVCWAPLKAAADMGIPTVIHESNSVAGRAVRMLEGKVDLIVTNFDEASEGLKNKNKAVRVGNPVRRSFEALDKAQARRRLGIPDSIKFVILSFGGSLGAPKVNEAAIDVMRKFSAVHDDVMHFHAGGKNSYKKAMQMFVGYSLENNPRLDVKEYIYDMPLYMAAADVCICRAGAMTLTELAMLRKPSILIPSPNVTDNHQYRNARALDDKGAAVLIEEEALTADGIANEVERIYSEPRTAQKMSEAISCFANAEAGDEIYELIKALIKSKAKINGKGK